jgi:hypothetical protein
MLVEVWAEFTEEHGVYRTLDEVLCDIMLVNAQTLIGGIPHGKSKTL